MRHVTARFALLCVLLPGVQAAPVSEHEGDNGASMSGLSDSTWQVEDIDEGGIIDRSMITLAFTADGRVAGSTGCNRYFAHAWLDGDVITVSNIGSTRRACPTALMQQEQRFLDALGAAARHERDEVGRLLIYDGAGARRLLAVEIDSDPTARSGGRRPDG